MAKNWWQWSLLTKTICHQHQRVYCQPHKNLFLISSLACFIVGSHSALTGKIPNEWTKCSNASVISTNIEFIIRISMMPRNFIAHYQYKWLTTPTHRKGTPTQFDFLTWTVFVTNLMEWLFKILCNFNVLPCLSRLIWLSSF